MRIILFIVCTILAILLLVSIIALVPDVLDRFYRGGPTDLDLLLVLIAILLVVLMTLRLNLIILQKKWRINFCSEYPSTKRNS